MPTSAKAAKWTLMIPKKKDPAGEPEALTITMMIGANKIIPATTQNGI
jgi:hypothetical protein